MRQSTRRRQLEQSQRGWVAFPRGPFGPVKIQAVTADQLVRAEVSACEAARATFVPELGHLGCSPDRSMSMTAFFEYLHDHKATTDLARALADVTMLRTTGARRVPTAADERMAS